MIRTGNLQEGGVYLGKGRYGCVYSPPLKCSKKVTIPKNSVGKITSIEDSRVEISISDILSKHKNAANYFVLILKSCIPEPRSKQTESTLDSCAPIQGVDLSNTVQLLMPYAGKTIRQIPKNIRTIHYFDMGRHILEAGSLLLLSGIVHGDLHEMNILSTNPSSAKFIDFGNSWIPKDLTLKNVSQLYREFKPVANHEPPEVSFINGILDQQKEEIIVAKIQDEKRTIQLLHTLFGITVDSQIKTFKNFLQGSKSFREMNWYTYFSLYWSKIDAWSIGSILVLIFEELCMDPGFEKTEEYKKYAKIAKKVIQGLCETDPAKRIDALEALELWAPDSHIFESQDAVLWIKKQKEQRKLLEILI